MSPCNVGSSSGTRHDALTKYSLVEYLIFIEVADTISKGMVVDLNITFSQEEILEHTLDVSIGDYDINWANIPHTRAL